MKNTAHIEKIIENQFPNVYLEEGMPMVEFVKAYYAFMETNYADHKNIVDNIDIDNTVEEFVDHFKETYLKDFPFVSATDTRFMMKHIMDYYRSKGTVESTQLLLRMLFNEESTVYFPSNDIFKLSDSEWYVPTYLEVGRSDRSVSFLNKQITGSRSKAKAIVEGVVTKRVNGRYIDVIYLSDIRGTFLYDEKISDDGNLKNAPTTVGSLTTLSVVNGGRDNVVGDVLDVVGNGVNGKVRVSAIENATGRVDFALVNGGSGYTATSDTDVYVSDAVITINNPTFDYIQFETVSQKMENLELLSASDIIEDATAGNFVVGINPLGVQVANGVIIEASNYISDTSNVVLKTQLVIQSGTFDRQEKIRLSSNTPLLIGETIEEETQVDIEVADVVGTLQVGHKIEQATTLEYGALTADIVLNASATPYQLRETVVQYNANNDISVSGQVINRIGNTLKIRGIHTSAGPDEFLPNLPIVGLDSQTSANVVSVAIAPSTELYTNFAFGTIQNVSGTTISVKPSWGLFSAGTAVKTYANNTTTTSQASASVTDTNIIVQGARGIVSAKTANTVIIENIFGDFSVGNQIRGDKSFNVGTITAVENEGATDVWLNGIQSANGVIDLVANTTAQGIVIGQNTSSIGVHGNTSPFYAFSDTSVEQTQTTITNMTATVGNVGTFTTASNPNGFSTGNNVSLEITFFQGGEIKTISGVYLITASNNSTFSIQLSSVDGQNIRDGGFIISTSKAVRSVAIPVKTDRKQLISPPRDANGTIIEVVRDAITVSTGVGADFKVGSLENEEVVFLATDIIGANNIVGIPFMDIQINGGNSGIGFVDSIIINSGGTGYSNGEVITFVGGGFAEGDPLVGASGIISTNGSGSIVDVTMNNHGQGYWGEPTYSIQSGNATANLDVSMDYGIGFEKAPNGDHDTLIQDMLTLQQFTIGTISSLNAINPGSDYNTDPFVSVYNKYVAGFQRSDFIIELKELDGNFLVGENVVQNITGDNGEVFAKGYILSSTSSQIVVRRTSFNTSFNKDINIQGATSGATALVDGVVAVQDAFVMGDNATITGTVFAANGIATEVEVIDSGIGYVGGEEVNLETDSSPFIVSGISQVKSQGIGTGFWRTSSSHINSSSRIHDNVYYQEFSYEVVVGRSVDKYQKILKNVLHVAGSAIFGRVEKRNTGGLQAKSELTINISTN